MENCIFCKIIKGEIPNYTVYEDDKTLAFLDIAPRSPGHTVVIPKSHVERVSDLADDSVSALFSAVKKTAAKIETALKPDGFNIGWNDGAAAGQVVPHLHIHILPRWTGDGGGNMHSIVNNPGEMSVEKVFNKLNKL